LTTVFTPPRFTSHIVQIKLYVQQALREILEELYIPHSSDKTRKKTLSPSPLRRLYIPHSSDKTEFHRKKRIPDHKVFTSHIVQIKHSAKNLDLDIDLDFTSHIVQIKQDKIIKIETNNWSSLHPT